MEKSKNVSRLLVLITILGILVFCIKSWNYTNSLVSVGDEGSYLYKGYLFARGDYYPFQEYTFWTNKAPLSFLIPGYIQLWFGPGLREGRYFALAISFFMLLGVWMIANRLGGKGWAALAIWVYALSSGQIAVLSQALSQGLVACLLTWMFVFVLGEKRSTWQLIVGSVLSVFVIMTRQNMLPVPVFLVAYIFWQYGRKAGFLSLGTVVLSFLFFYLLYGQGLLDLWLSWLPNLQTPFDKVVASASSNANTGFEITRLLSRVRSFALNIHDHFLIMMGSVGAVILWPSINSWKSRTQFKMAIFLAVTFFALFLMHVWASIFNDYCIWCLPAYQVFYNPAGLFFIILVFSNVLNNSNSRRYILSFYLVFVALNMGLYYSDIWSDWLLQKIHVPLLGRLFSEGRFSTVSLVDVLTELFSLSMNTQRHLVSALAGIFVGVVLVGIAWGIHYFLIEKRFPGVSSVIGTILVFYSTVGVILMLLLDRPMNSAGCSNKFLTYYENAGRDLAALAPTDGLIYWQGSGRHLALMLYMKDIRIFPPQIHAGGGNYRTDDDNIDDLLRIGRFNQAIDEQWREQADFFVIWGQYMTPDVESFFEQPQYTKVDFDIGPLGSCEDDLLVFETR